MGMLKISTFTNDSVKCRAYFNNDGDNGVEIYNEGSYAGKIVGIELPDEDDDEAIEQFTDIVETWLIDNGY